MRYAIISDIHANLEALTAVLAEIEKAGVDEIVCLGDLVGYNANPKECVDIIRTRGIRTVMGNHGSRVVDASNSYDFNSMARNALEWTHDHLDKEHVDYLQGLQHQMVIDNRFLIVHGSVGSTYEYISSSMDATRNFRLLDQQHDGIKLCFYGHTHVPAVFMNRDRRVFSKRIQDFYMNSASSYLVNPGSVGQPRDGDPRASYIIYNTRRRHISFNSVNYDVELAAKKIRESTLPNSLAERLERGI